MVLAVHISDGVLSPTCLGLGFAGAILLAVLGSWRIRDEEIPRIALLTAAFFVISFVHISIGPTSVHLLMTGLIGVLLGPRAALAIPVGLVLQAVLAQHGGVTALGVNSVIMTVPALLAWQLLSLLGRVPWVRRTWFRAATVALSVAVWILSVVFSFSLLVANGSNSLSMLDVTPAIRVACSYPMLLVVVLAGTAAAWLEGRMETTPEFPIGLLIGQVSVLTTVALNAVVLRYGGQEDWHSLVLLMLVPHVFIALVEGVVLGFMVGFLARVKPELVPWRPERSVCLADPGC